MPDVAASSALIERAHEATIDSERGFLFRVLGVARCRCGTENCAPTCRPQAATSSQRGAATLPPPLSIFEGDVVAAEKSAIPTYGCQQSVLTHHGDDLIQRFIGRRLPAEQNLVWRRARAQVSGLSLSPNPTPRSRVITWNKPPSGVVG